MRKLYWLVIAIITIEACTKIESTTLGSDLIPPVDNVNTFDTTLEVFTANYVDSLQDSIRVLYNEEHVIGGINNDPLFGTTQATTFFELKPSFYKYYFPSGGQPITADSAVLVLSFRGIYGDNLQPHHWAVKEVSETLSDTTSYTVSELPGTEGSFLNDPSQAVSVWQGSDSVKNAFETATNQVRIKLTPAFAARLMKSYDSTNAYISDSTFRINFKGFAVGPYGAGENALIRVNLLDTNTKLALYYSYKKTGGTSDTSLVNYFRFNSGNMAGLFSGSGNYIKRNYSGSQAATAFANTGTNSPAAFVQAAPGTFVTLKIPGISALPNMIVHRAELLAFQDKDLANEDALFGPPSYLLLSGYDYTKKVKVNVPHDFIIDQSGNLNEGTFGGYPIDRSIDGQVVSMYNFDITRYLQGVLSRKEPAMDFRITAPTNDSLRYTPPYPANTASVTFSIPASTTNTAAIGRVRLGGGALTTSSQVRMRLHIVFSRI